MEKDGNTPGRFRLPESLAETGDPIEGNPYPTQHPAHQVWIDATRKAEWMPTLVVAKFDAWARRGVQVVWTDENVREYDHWLLAYANGWIESVSRLLTDHPPPFSSEIVLADLRRRLAARVHRWKAEARRYRIQQEAHAAAAPGVERPPSDQLVERRRLAVQRYRDDHNLDAIGFARKVGISDTAVRGIIREDSSRFNRGTQEKLLAVIGMTREDWYKE